MKPYKIVHISDTHIRNYNHHKEYREIFAKMYDRIREIKPDYIVHTGDIAHTKTQLSPEYFDLATDFLKNLSAISPLYIILGNHDTNLKNFDRQDAITPIVTALNNPDIHLMKYSGEYEVDTDLSFHVLSIFDEGSWKAPSSNDKINIALYHGAISGIKVETGFVMREGDHDISIFNAFDYALLGDIHVTNQKLNESGTIRYCGSTVQQSFAETNDKGFLEWNIKSKTNFTCKMHSFENPKPYITIELNQSGKIPKGFEAPHGARLRVIADSNLPVDKIHNVIETIKYNYKPESVVFHTKNAEVANDSFETFFDFQEDLRDQAVQEKLIKEHLKDFNISKDTLKKVYQLNNKYNALAEAQEEVARNVKWELTSLEWDNLFNFGSGNSLNFAGLNGIVGLLGKNFLGKTSTIDATLFTLFNATSKNERKNVNVVNQHKQEASCHAILKVGDSTYHIERDIVKYTKRLKNEESEEAKVELNFYKTLSDGSVVSLNGLSRNETDQNIRRTFGTVEDFLYTSMSSQHDNLSFVKEGSTKRKEIMAKFLDLDIFETKFKLAKEQSAELKGSLKKFENKKFAEEIESLKLSIDSKTETLKDKSEQRDSLIQKGKLLEGLVAEEKARLDRIPKENIDSIGVYDSYKKHEKELSNLHSEKAKLESEISSLDAKIKAFENALKSSDIKLWKENVADGNEIVSHVESLTKRLHETEKTHKQMEKQSRLLDEVPCGTQFPTCKFIKEAFSSRQDIAAYEAELSEIKESLSTSKKELEEMQYEVLLDKIKKYNEIDGKVQSLKTDLKIKSLKMDNIQSSIENKAIAFENEKKKVEVFEQNRELFKEYDAIKANIKELESKSSLNTIQTKNLETEISSINRSLGSDEQKIESLKEQEQEVKNLKEEFAVYDLFMRCMHSSGIAYSIIKQKLPFINDEISKILTNLTEFEVFFKEEDNRLELFIKHPKHDPRPIVMASGAEKTMAAMAIRLALLTVSSLPQSSIIILDEPGTALDEEHLASFKQLLEVLKNKFKTVILISHLEALKDVVDTTIDITRKDGFAYINQ